MIGCVEWSGAKSKGYGRVYLNGRDWLVHRLVYELYHGEKPDVVRHTCDNPACYNIEHLEGGTQLDNMRDMYNRNRDAGSKRTHCINGHAFDEQNIILEGNGSRRCRSCHNIRNKKLYWRKKQMKLDMSGVQQ